MFKVYILRNDVCTAKYSSVSARLIHLSDGGPEHSRETDRSSNNRSSIRSVHSSSRSQVIPPIFIVSLALEDALWVDPIRKTPSYHNDLS